MKITNLNSKSINEVFNTPHTGAAIKYPCILKSMSYLQVNNGIAIDSSSKPRVIRQTVYGYAKRLGITIKTKSVLTTLNIKRIR